jgi:hypothetical protein
MSSATHSRRAARGPASRFLLMLEDGEPCDPAVFVGHTADWQVGDTFLTAEGRQFRILATETAVHVELVEHEFNGIWTVEPV